MTRYIDANALLNKIPDDLPYKASVKRVLMQAPDVDVVPRVAVKRMEDRIMMLNEILNSYALQYGTAIDKEIILKQVKSEVAREICCEIEEEIVGALESNYRVLADYDDGRCNEYILELVNRVKGKVDALRGIESIVEELKKKYTEGENNK